MLSVDPGAMTRMLDRLACKGWIEWLPNPADKRRAGAVDAGRRSLCESVIRLWVRSELTKNLSADEVAMLEQLLKKVLP